MGGDSAAKSRLCWLTQHITPYETPYEPGGSRVDEDILRQAMSPTSVSDATLADYLPHFVAAMQAAQITTERRAAAWCSQLGHESAGLKFMAEIATDGPGWTDDRRIYRGRGPIQLTWPDNYRKFGQWCATQGFTADPELFFKQPELVEQPRWGFLAASWYWINGGPKPGRINEFADAGDILAVSRCINGWIEGRQPNGMVDRQARWDRCLDLGGALLAHIPTGGSTMPNNRPDFNEYANWTKNNSSRGGAKVDLFLLHTQEGGGGDDAADNLAKFIRSTESLPPNKKVSYHYVLSQASDGGVTVVDCVDTDFESWSVLSANSRSINLCFAGSLSKWTREQWLQQAKAIDVAAYLAVQDCKKYGISTQVVARPYTSGTPGISDHFYVTHVLGDGDHTDVGSDFPWDVFTTAVNKYASGLAPEITGLAPEITPTPEITVMVQRLPQDLTDRKVLEDIWMQLLGPEGRGWPQLGQNEHGQDLTLLDALAALRKPEQ
jgi:predicted chitinase